MIYFRSVKLCLSTFCAMTFAQMGIGGMLGMTPNGIQTISDTNGIPNNNGVPMPYFYSVTSGVNGNPGVLDMNSRSGISTNNDRPYTYSITNGIPYTYSTNNGIPYTNGMPNTNVVITNSMVDINRLPGIWVS